MRLGLQGERLWFYNQIPELREIESTTLSVQQLQNIKGQLVTLLQTDDERYLGLPLLAELDGLGRFLQSYPQKVESSVRRYELQSPWLAELDLFFRVLRTYPQARRSLIAAGRKAQDVEATPAFQVVMIYSHPQYRAWLDEHVKKNGSTCPTGKLAPAWTRWSENSSKPRLPMKKVSQSPRSSYQQLGRSCSPAPGLNDGLRPCAASRPSGFMLAATGANCPTN